MERDEKQPKRMSARFLGLEVSFTSKASGRRWRALPIVGAALGVVLAGGVAYAAVTPWTVSGSGQGGSAAGTANAFVVSAGTSGTALYPSGSGDVVIVLSNPYPFNVSVSALALSNTGITAYNDAALTDTSGTAATCQTNGSGVSWKTAGTKTLGTPIVIAAKSGGTNGTYTLTLTGNASMSSSSDNACQGKYFAMPITGITASQTSAVATSPTTGSQS